MDFSGVWLAALVRSALLSAAQHAPRPAPSTERLDRSFARGGVPLPICRSVIALGRSMGLRVLAEGVETQAHWQLLRADGCEEAQGYWFAKPLPLPELEQWLAQHAS